MSAKHVQEADPARRSTPLPAVARHPALSRPYQVLAFDWDGTAVESRRHPTDSLRQRTEALAQMGVWLVVITGTKFENLDEQYFRKLRPPARPHHLACVNRGSEVFGFDDLGRVQVRQRRVATAQENGLMDEIAVLIKRELQESHSLTTAIVFDRFNRRKLDLIPAGQWADPPKARIGELLAAVNARLSEAGIRGGIRSIMDRIRELGDEHGIDLKLTSDVKHVEFGLTDKADSVAYLADVFAPGEGLRGEDTLVLGDEFGPIDGLEGSDYKTCVLPGATYVSVGKEPNGVPQGVLHVGGGVPAFLALLDRQVRLTRRGPQA
jgi:hypothetical protein